MAHPWVKSVEPCPRCDQALEQQICEDRSCRECLGDLAGYRCKCGWSGDGFDLAEERAE